MPLPSRPILIAPDVLAVLGKPLALGKSEGVPLRLFVGMDIKPCGCFTDDAACE